MYFFLQVSLFAELFNEMLMRDCGFNIYKALLAAPEKPKEEKKEKDKEKKKDKDEVRPIGLYFHFWTCANSSI